MLKYIHVLTWIGYSVDSLALTQMGLREEGEKEREREREREICTESSGRVSTSVHNMLC